MKTVRRACFLLAAFVQLAAAGAWLVEAGTDYRGGAKIRREIKIDAWRVSIEIQDADSHQTIVYQRSPERVWMLDHAEKFYREFDDATLKMLRAQVQAVREMADKQGRTAPDSRIVFTKVWAGEKVGERNCDRYEGRLGGVKIWDICAADWSQFETRASDFDPLREAVNALRTVRLWPEDALLLPSPPGKKVEGGFLGMPIQRMRQQDDQPLALLEVREIAVREFTDADFSPPSDYITRPVFLVPAESGEDHKTGARPERAP